MIWIPVLSGVLILLMIREFPGVRPSCGGGGRRGFANLSDAATTALMAGPAHAVRPGILQANFRVNASLYTSRRFVIRHNPARPRQQETEQIRDMRST